MNYQRYYCRSFTTMLAALLVLAFLESAVSWSAEIDQASSSFDASQKQDIQKIIRDYLLTNPEVIAEAINKLDEKQKQDEEQKRQAAAQSARPISPGDHLQGQPNAPVKLIEFSDLECPFCKRFHPVMQQVMDEYGKDGRVAVVYRHFPLDQLHSKARKEAQAAECAGELGGNEAFWAMVNKIFEVTPSNNQLDLTALPTLATQIGLDGGMFSACMEGDMRGGKYAAHIEADYRDALASGGTGTPYTLVISPNGSVYPVNGAMPYEEVKSIIDAALLDK